MKVTIYGKPMCPACNKAKDWLTARNVEFEYKELNKDYNIVEFYEVAPRSHRTFPMIAVNGEYVGTFADYLESIYVKS